MPLDVAKIRRLIGTRTQADVARSAGMMQSGLARLLAGKFDPKLSTVERLAKALGVSAREIIKK